MTKQQPITSVIFDIGNTLIAWDPRYLYRKLFAGNETAMEHFLTEICSESWNAQQDRGRSWAEAIAETTAKYPAYASLIRAYWDRWEEMIPNAIPGSVAIFEELEAAGVALYAITNFSDETLPLALARFPFLRRFRDMAVSARLGVLKPDAAIYKHLLAWNGLDPRSTVFIDDQPRNVAAAADLGMHAIHFQTAEQTRSELVALGVPLTVGGQVVRFPQSFQVTGDS